MGGIYPIRQLLLIVMLCAAVVSAAAVAVGASSTPLGLLAHPERCAAVASNADLPRDLFASRITLWNIGGQEIDASRRELLALIEPPHGDACTNRWQIGSGLRRALSLTVAARPAGLGVLSLSIVATPSDDVSAVGICLPKAHDEHFYGLGERFRDLDLAGQRLENWTVDAALPHQAPMTYAPAPFLLSSRGYGLLLDTTTQATFDLRLSVDGCYRVRIEAPEMHLYLIAGPDPRTVVERHAHLVGLPPLPPPWAFGVWKTLIGGQARVTSDLARLREDDVPIDAVWIYDAVDERAGFGWPWQIYGPIAPGPYPELVGFIRQLHAQDLKVLGYLNPFVYLGTASFEEAQRRGFLVRGPDDQPYVEAWSFGKRAYLDFTNPQAVAWWQARVGFALGELDFDGAMLDFGEDAPLDGHYASGQPGARVHNLYPVLYQRAAYLAGQAAKPGGVVFLARAGYSGSQPYTTGRFTGDQVRSWDSDHGLPSVLPAMLNGGLSGWPYWGPDIAGFSDAVQDDTQESFQQRADRIAAEKELWMRWVQLGALSPTMRDMYGMQRDPVDLWTDDETLAVFRAYARLHHALQPYLYHYAEVAHQSGLPILRPLFLNYPAEDATYTLDDEYLIGDDLLVAPVLRAGQSERHLYLPSGRWRDYWTGAMQQGPRWITVATPVQRAPVFIRAGATVALPDVANLELPEAASEHNSARSMRSPLPPVSKPPTQH